jgi:hypothetical protein
MGSAFTQTHSLMDNMIVLNGYYLELLQILWIADDYTSVPNFVLPSWEQITIWEQCWEQSK